MSNAKETIKTKISNLIFRKIKKHIRTFGYTLDEYIDNEAERRSKFWQEEMTGYAKAANKLNNIIFEKDEEISALKSQISDVPTKKQILDNYLQEQIDSGDLTGHNLTEKQLEFSRKHSWPIDVLSIKEIDNEANLLTDKEKQFEFSRKNDWTLNILSGFKEIDSDK